MLIRHVVVDLLVTINPFTFISRGFHLHKV